MDVIINTNSPIHYILINVSLWWLEVEPFWVMAQYILGICLWYLFTEVNRDQIVFVRPMRPTFFTWNFTTKQYEDKKKSNIHSKNTVKVTFAEFFDVKVRFFAVKVLIIYLLPSQHLYCEDFVFYSFLDFFTSKMFF